MSKVSSTSFPSSSAWRSTRLPVPGSSRIAETIARWYFTPYSFFARSTYLSKSLPNARISMKKIFGSIRASCSLAMIACLVAYMQQTEEHQGLALCGSREPTHWIQATLTGCVAVRGALHDALGGAGGGEDPLELDRGHDVRPAPEAEFAAHAGVVELGAGGEDHRADLQLDLLLVGRIVHDRLGEAGVDAEVALAAAAAVEAAPGLLDAPIVSGKPSSVSLKLPRRSASGSLGMLRLGAGGDLRDILDELRAVLELRPVLVQVQPAQVAVDRLRAVAPHADRLHDGARPGDHVAAGEDARAAGGQRRRVGLEALPLVGLEVLPLEAGEVRLLADRGDQHVAGEHVVRALDRHRPAAAALVRLAELHLLHFQAGDLAVRADHPDRGDEGLDLDALLLGLLDLPGVGRHLRDGAPVGDHDLGAEPQRGARRVDRRVAAADHDDLLARRSPASCRG